MPRNMTFRFALPIGVLALLCCGLAICRPHSSWEHLIVFAGMGFVGIVVPLGLSFVASHRLSAMVAHFEKIAMQPDTTRIESVNVCGKDEIGTLASSFNVLVERLNTAYDSLDARVQERTAQLALANEALERENVERKRAEAKLREYTDLLRYKNIELEAQKQQLLAQQEELKSINRELGVATAAATSANCAKSEFLANMSHEIRTPMTAVSGYTDLMLDMVCRCPACPNGKQCEVGQNGYEYLSSIRRNGDHLLQLIDDILDLSKVESGILGIDRAPCSPLEIMDEVQSLMQIRADSRKLVFAAKTAGPVPETILSDARRIKQILLNLVGNAIKFTASGSVTLTTRMSDEWGIPSIEFAVTDTGIGIAPEQFDHLFKPFNQLDTSAARQFGGSGLGLAISKRIAEILGGSISVNSEPGKGSTFTVTIATGPIVSQRMIESHQHVRVAPAPVANEVELLLPSDCRVLLAEDGPDNQKLISFLLQRAGATVELCENGQIAIAAAQAAEKRGEPFDVILMDMQMPVLDGYRATQILREQGYDRPIIALTAHAMTNDRDRCLEVGCNGFATKPISRKRLIGLIADSLAHSSAHVHA